MQQKIIGKEYTGKFAQILQKTETKLLLFFAYISALIYVLITTHSWQYFIVVHLISVTIFSMVYFFNELVLILCAPIIAILIPTLAYFVKRYLRNFKQNVPANTVIILGRYDWFKFEAWVKPNFLKREIEPLVKLLEAQKRDFSFYPNASREDVEKIMGDRNIKEVYFLGHGDSHCFQLGNDDILYYCDFNDLKYGKEYVHQVHCGTTHGKSLIDYVVPEGNEAECFLFRRSINSSDIQKEFKRRIKIASE